MEALREEFDLTPKFSEDPEDRIERTKPRLGSITGGAPTKDDVDFWAVKKLTKAERKKKQTYNGSFAPDYDGLLSDNDLASDLRNGYMTADELIDGILKYNEAQSKKDKKDQKPIVMVLLFDNDLRADTTPFVRLSVGQMARAKEVIFATTDEAGAEAAEKDTKRFTVMKLDIEGKKIMLIAVLRDDGTLSEEQVKELASIELLVAIFGNPKDQAKDADGNYLTAKIVIPEEFTNVLDMVFERTEDFLRDNPRCKTTIKMHYRDATKLRDGLVRLCEKLYPQQLEGLTLEFVDSLPEGFEELVNAELALQNANVSVKGNTITFKKVEINEDAVKAYFGTHADITIPKVFANVCSPNKLMPLVLDRTSDTPLTLDMRAYENDAIKTELFESLKAISKTGNPKGLNLKIVLPSGLDAESFADNINNDLRADKRHLKEVEIPNDSLWTDYGIRFETEEEAYARRLHGAGEEKKPELKQTKDKKGEEHNDEEHEVGVLSPEAIEKQIADCLKAIETVISGFEPKTFKDVPVDIEKEPETKEGEGMSACFKRLLLGYCRHDGLTDAVEVDRGDLNWKKRDKFTKIHPNVVKDLLEEKGKSFGKALLDKINPILKEKNKVQVMTKAFASRVWKCIVYYCDNGEFPDVSLLDRKNVFEDIRRDASNFLKNNGDGDCGVISVLQGNALIDDLEADKTPSMEWTPKEIQRSRNGAAGAMAGAAKEERKGENGEPLKFLSEDAAKWDVCTRRINDLESKGKERTDKETWELNVAKNRRDELERNFTKAAAGKRIRGAKEGAMKVGTLYDRCLLPDDFRWFAKLYQKTISLVQDGREEPLINLYFRDGTQLSNGTAFFENLLTEEAAKRIICIYMAPRFDIDKDDGKNITHYKAFTERGRKALFGVLGYRKDDGTKELKTTFFKEELDLTGASDATMRTGDVERRMRARILFECDPAGFTKACFTDIKPKSVKFPSYQIYGEQQENVLKALSATEDDLDTKLQWAPSLTDDELKVLNGKFGQEHRHLVEYTDGNFKFETVEERIDRWKDKMLYKPTMTDDGVLNWTTEKRLVEDLKKAPRSGSVYFWNLLCQYTKKEENSYKYGGKVVKTIDVHGLEDLVFSDSLEYLDYFNYVTERRPGIAFRVSTSFKRAKDTRSIKVTAVGDNQLDCVMRTEDEIKAWDDANLPELENKRSGEFVHEDYWHKVFFEKSDLKALQKCSAKDLILLLSEVDAKAFDCSEHAGNAKVFKDTFKNKEDVKHFGLLGKAQLWVPKNSAAHFDDRNLFKDGKDKKESNRSEYLLFSVLPQSVGIQFIEEEITTKKKQNNLEVVRLVWNAYARYLLGCAKRLAKDKNATGCEAFADKIAKVAAEQNFAKVCVDLSGLDYDETFGNMFVLALSERGIDVLVKKSSSEECLENFIKDKRDGIRGVYKDKSNDIWFLPGADLSVSENKTAADEKTKELLDKKNALLQAISTNTDADIKLSEEMLSLATVKEIFDALEKNQTDGMVSLTWRENHPLEGDLLAWARAYCGSKTEEKRALMKRCIKLVPEEEDDKDFLPKTFEQDVMTGNHGAFGCLCDSKNGTVTFFERKNWLNEKRKELLDRIAENGQRNITEYDWDAARFFFSDLVVKKMEKGYGGFYFYPDPNIETLLDDISSYAAQPRAERVNDLEIEFDKGVKISASLVRDFLKDDPERKARISYETYKTKKGIVESVTLKSRYHYLLGTVEKNKKLAFAAADIHSANPNSSFSSLLRQSVNNGLEELIVPQEVLYEMHQETFLEGVKSMLSSASQSVKVTSKDPGAIDLLLKELGSDSKWNKFFIKDTDTSCHSTTRKQFLSDCYDKLKAEIQNNHDDGKPFEVSGNNIATDKVNDICSCMNQKDRHGHLTLKMDAKTCADAVKYILNAGVKRSWILECKAPVNLAAMVDKMANGWALDCSPSSKTETAVLFFPKDNQKGLYDQMFNIFKDIFLRTNDAYLVSKQYWGLGIKPILEAADDPNSKISHLDFLVDPDEKLLALLTDELKEFCKTTRAGRPGAWDIRIFGSYDALAKLYWGENKLTKDCKADDRKRILQLKERNNEANKYNKNKKSPYCAEITMPSAETFFSSEIVGKKEQDEAIGRRDSDLDGLSIGNALRYLNLPESEYCKLFILEQKPTEKGELVDAVKQVLTNPTGRTGWIAAFKNPVVKETDAQTLLALNDTEGVQRYVIPCGDRCLLFVNKAMYDLWNGKLRQAEELTVTKQLTEQTDGFLPILFAASTPSSKTTKLIIPADVDPFKGGSDCYRARNPFHYLIDCGGGRTGWDIVFDGRTKNPYAETLNGP